ncbi:FKBP-type peptidyl-prolyl cis-trans isomerase [Actinoplanes sp. GCM10030250]|uniref:FKBP-type peptidyl-prolyl cis-trans isomerase n=1 Tax=Actinoplanes sp. GCM10030250 TaxID=3273376 RepID=UPI00361A5C49
MSDQTGSNSKRRGRAVAGALTGVLVFAVLSVVFFLLRPSSDDTPATTEAAATQAAPASAAPAPSAAAPPDAVPSAAGSAKPPASGNPLEQEPDVKPGTGTVSKTTITEIIAGTGPVVKSGQTITVNYKVIQYTTGNLIDSSWGKEPFSVPIGVGNLIKGWDEAIPGQKVGSRIQLDVPAALAYGPEQGDLRFVVDILDAK